MKWCRKLRTELNTYHSLSDLSLKAPSTSWGLLMGNFDGLHLGHRDLIKKTMAECQKQGLDLVVLSFNPHPICILKPSYEPFLINTYAQKKEFLKELGVKNYVEMSFTRDLSTQSPEEFLDQHLLAYDQLKALYFGYDFTFGANKKGNFSFVQKYCKNKVIVKKLNVFSLNGIEISSSLVREKIMNKETQLAGEYLGRLFFIEGLVTKGEGRGKKIGFPTANLSFHKDLIIPHSGVYSSYTELRGMNYKSITNVGMNPTFNDMNKVNVETYIFDFDDDLYGESIKVNFRDFIRDEKKFHSVNELVDQIKLDCQIAKK